MGYRRDPEDKHTLLVDEEAAEIIRRIFRMAAEGTGVTEIAKTLNEEGVPSPSQYRKLKGPKTRQDYGALDPKWSYSSVHEVLIRYSYTGALVADTKLRTAPCSKKFRKQPRENGSSKKAIIPRLSAQKSMRKRRKSSCRCVKEKRIRRTIRSGHWSAVEAAEGS